MKKTAKKVDMETVVRLLGGILLILAGVTIMILYGLKVVPEGWDTSRELGAITVLWAYGGGVLGAVVTVGGVSMVGVVDWLMEKMGL